MEEEKKTSLYIPFNIRKRKEYVDGFGKPELIQTCVGTAIGLGISIILCIFVLPNIITLVFPTIMIGAMTAMLVRKNSFNRSSIDAIKNVYNFKKGQKRYFYKYTNIYESEVTTNGKKK